jgi:hypothetical protein
MANFLSNLLSPISLEVDFQNSSSAIKQWNLIFYVSSSLYQSYILKTKSGKYPRSIRFYLGSILIVDWMDWWYSMAARNMQPENLLLILGLLLSLSRIFANTTTEQEFRNFLFTRNHFLRAFSTTDHTNIKRNISRCFNGMRVKFTQHLHSPWLILTWKWYKDLSWKSHVYFFPPVSALAASMKLSVSFQLLDLGQSAGLLGRVISSSQGLS